MKPVAKAQKYAIYDTDCIYKFRLGRKIHMDCSITRPLNCRKNTFKFKAPARSLEIGIVKILKRRGSNRHCS